MCNKTRRRNVISGVFFRQRSYFSTLWKCQTKDADNRKETSILLNVSNTHCSKARHVFVATSSTQTCCRHTIIGVVHRFLQHLQAIILPTNRSIISKITRAQSNQQRDNWSSSSGLDQAQLNSTAAENTVHSNQHPTRLAVKRETLYHWSAHQPQQSYT